MFSIQPDKRWFEFGDEPLEDLPFFRMNADGTVRGVGPGASAALPGGTVFNVRPERHLPGLHNFRPSEEVGAGFRMNADGSMQDPSTLSARPTPDTSGNPFDPFDQPGTKSFTSVGDRSPSSRLTYRAGLSNGLDEVPTLDDGEPGGKAISPLFNSPFFSGISADGPPFVAPPPLLPPSGPAPSGELRPVMASFGYLANPAMSPLQPAFDVPTPEAGSSGADAGLDNDVVLPERPVSDGPLSVPNKATDPNIVRTGNGDAAAPTGNVQIAQAPEKPQSKLRKDPSPGVVVVLPDKSTIPDSQSPTGQLMAPIADLSEVAAAGRQARGTLDDLSVFPPAYLAYLAGTLGVNVGHGGTFDYQRRGNRITGYTHLPQFQKVSNLNVGLFAQQAGLTLEQVLKITGEFARQFSSNAKEGEPYGLDPIQLEFIRLGYKIGESGMFDRPPVR